MRSQVDTLATTALAKTALAMADLVMEETRTLLA
jgi:hypothetical protein